MTNVVVVLPCLLPVQSERSSAQRAMEIFFAAEINNPCTRRAYTHAARDFFAFASSSPNVVRLDNIEPLHVAAWLELMKVRGLSSPTIKQRLAGLKMLFQSLIRQRVMTSNPADVVKGPSHSVTRGKTPVLDGTETSRLLSSIDTSTLIGLRDRAMIGAMAFSFARISAVTALKVGDVFRQKQRLWLRLGEKGGKSKDVPCHHQLETFIVCQRRSDFPSSGRSNIPSLQTARRPPRAGAFLLSGAVFLRPNRQSAARSVFALRARRLDWLSR